MSILSKEAFVSIGTATIMAGSGVISAKAEAIRQENDPPPVPSIEITPTIEIEASSGVTRAVPVPTFEVPIGFLELVKGQFLESTEWAIPTSSYIELVSQYEPNPESIHRFESLLETFSLLANDRLQDPLNPENPVNAVGTYIEFNRGEDGIIRGSLYAQVTQDGLVSRDNPHNPIRINSIFTPFITSDGTRQEIGVMNDDDGAGNLIELDIDLIPNGEEFTGILIKGVNTNEGSIPVSILTETENGTANELAAQVGNINSEGVNFRDLAGTLIGPLEAGDEIIMLPTPRSIPGQEELGLFYEVLVNGQIGLVSVEFLDQRQNFDFNQLHLESENTSPEPDIELSVGERRDINSLLVNGQEIIGDGLERNIDGQSFTVFTDLAGIDLNDFNPNILKNVLASFGMGFYRTSGEAYSQGETFNWFDGIPTEFIIKTGHPSPGEFIYADDIANTEESNDISALAVRLEDGKRIITAEYTQSGFEQWMSEADPNNHSDQEFRARSFLYNALYNSIVINSTALRDSGSTQPSETFDRSLHLNWNNIWDNIAQFEGVDLSTTNSQSFDYSVIWNSEYYPEAYRLFTLQYTPNN